MQPCAHCGSTETSQLFDTYQCQNCGMHTAVDGSRTLPGSLLVPPNREDNLAQYGAVNPPDELVNGPDRTRVSPGIADYDDPFAKGEVVEELPDDYEPRSVTATHDPVVAAASVEEPA
jgi:hypothetical protein